MIGGQPPGRAVPIGIAFGLVFAVATVTLKDRLTR